MAKLDAIHIKYCIVFFPVATYQRVGDITRLTVFGLQIYARVGDARSLFGFTWGLDYPAA